MKERKIWEGKGRRNKSKSLVRFLKQNQKKAGKKLERIK